MTELRKALFEILFELRRVLGGKSAGKNLGKGNPADYLRGMLNYLGNELHEPTLDGKPAWADGRQPTETMILAVVNAAIVSERFRRSEGSFARFIEQYRSTINFPNPESILDKETSAQAWKDLLLYLVDRAYPSESADAPESEWLERTLSEEHRKRLQWLWLQQAGCDRAFARQLAPNLPGGSKQPKEKEIRNGESCLRRIVDKGTCSAGTFEAMARTMGVDAPTLETLFGSDYPSLVRAIKGSCALLGDAGRHKFPVFRIAIALREYERRFSEAEGLVQILSMTRPRLLESIFTPVRVEAPIALTSPASFEDSWEDSVEDSDELDPHRMRPMSQSEESLVDGIRMANEETWLTVLGEPGAGKSTLLRRVGGLSLKRVFGDPVETFDHAKLPIFVQLKTFDPKDHSLPALVECKLSSTGFPAGFGEFLWNTGALLLLLDGLDEVPNDRMGAVVAEMGTRISSCKGARCIGSCRSAAYSNQWRGSRTVTLADFDNTQIRTFIEQKWFSHSTAARACGETLWKRLSNRSHAPVLELARSPLLLTFLCIVFESEMRLPSNRSRLYERVLSIILSEWSIEKGVHRELPFPGLNPDRELELLQDVAGPSFESNRAIFERAELTKAIWLFVTVRLGAPPQMDPEPVLNRMRSQQGIFVGQDGRYAFSHTTIHEFLAARYFNQVEATQRLVHDHLMEPRWREVFRLMAGITKRGTPLLLEMLRSIRSYWAAKPKAKRFLQWSASCVDDTGDPAGVTAKRLAVLTIARLEGVLRETTPDKLATVFGGANYDISVARDIITMLAPAIANSLGIVEERPWDVSRYLQSGKSSNLQTVEQLMKVSLFKPSSADALSRSLQDVQQDKHHPSDFTKPQKVEEPFIFRPAAEAWLRGLKLPEELWHWSENEKLELSVGFFGMELALECYVETRAPVDLWGRMTGQLLSVE